METMRAKMSDRELAMPAGSVRLLSDCEWINSHASGSLQKAKHLGMSWRPLYLEERTVHEWGWEFEVLPRTRVTFGDAIMEGDCAPLTEVVWQSKRLIDLNRFPDSDRYEVKYLQVETESGRREGAGVVLRETSAEWIPAGYLVFAIIAEFNAAAHKWERARNPA